MIEEQQFVEGDSLPTLLGKEGDTSPDGYLMKDDCERQQFLEGRASRAGERSGSHRGLCLRWQAWMEAI
jgi:hypothetical protein